MLLAETTPCKKCGWQNGTIRKRCRNCGHDLVLHPDASVDREMRLAVAEIEKIVAMDPEELN